MMRIAVPFIMLIVAGCTNFPKEHAEYAKGVFLSDEAIYVVNNGQLNPDSVSSIPNDALQILAVLSTKSTVPTERTKHIGDQDVQKAMISALIANSDSECEMLMNGVLTNSKSFMSASGVTSLALSTAASLTTPVRNSQLLSGLSAFAEGTETELKTTVLGGKEPDLVYKAVFADRRKERARLDTLIKAPNADLGSIWNEIPNYHRMCGTTHSEIALENAVSAASINAEQVGIADAKAEIKESGQ